MEGAPIILQKRVILIVQIMFLLGASQLGCTYYEENLNQVYTKLLSKEEGTYHTVILYDEEHPPHYSEVDLKKEAPEVFNGKLSWIENKNDYKLDLQEAFDIARLPAILIFDTEGQVFLTYHLFELERFLTKEISGRSYRAAEFIESHGYEAIQYTGSWTMTQRAPDLFHREHERYYWLSLDVDPEPYLDEKLYLYEFYAKNHPLDDMFGEGKTTLTIVFHDEEIIGGTSYPYSQHGVVGHAKMLDGTNPFDVKDTNKIFKDWQERFGD
jgi:hypothetical protein